MGARGILFGDNDWVRVALSSNENTCDNPVFGFVTLVPAVDGDSPCIAIFVEFLVEGEATELLLLLRCDTKEIMLIDECRCEVR